MTSLRVLSMLLIVPALVSAVPPPRMTPAIRVELTANSPNPGPMILEVYGGEFHRVDYRDTPNAQIIQLFWSNAEWKSFTGFLAKNKLATQGKVALKADSADGKEMIQYIHKHVIAPAATKANNDAAKKILQDLLRQKDLNNR